LEILEIDLLKINNRERSDHLPKNVFKRGIIALPGLIEFASVIDVYHMEALLDQEIDKLLKMKEAKNSKDKQVRHFV